MVEETTEIVVKSEGDMQNKHQKHMDANAKQLC